MRAARERGHAVHFPGGRQRGSGKAALISTGRLARAYSGRRGRPLTSRTELVPTYLFPRPPSIQQSQRQRERALPVCEDPSCARHTDYTTPNQTMAGSAPSRKACLRPSIAGADGRCSSVWIVSQMCSACSATRCDAHTNGRLFRCLLGFPGQQPCSCSCSFSMSCISPLRC